MQYTKEAIESQERRSRPVSLFNGVYGKFPDVLTVEMALERIKNGESKIEVEQIRLETDVTVRKRLKNSLHGITFSGLHKNRKELCKESGLACLDFDKVKNLKETKEVLLKSHYIMSCWISPSGNGIKALVKIPFVKYNKYYKEHYDAILEFYKDLNLDEGTSDMGRLCFESYDPQLYVNFDSKVFTKKIVIPELIASVPTYQLRLPQQSIINRLLSWWVKGFTFTEGNRNNSLYPLACALCEFGIFKETTQELLFSFESGDFPRREIMKIINSAYNNKPFDSKSFDR